MTDYRKFRLSKRNDPEFSHLKLLLFWPIYGLVFFALERLHHLDYHTIYTPLDDLVPFCEFFLFAYLQLSSPGFFDVLYHNGTGQAIMTAALALYLSACGLSARIMDIRV